MAIDTDTLLQQADQLRSSDQRQYNDILRRLQNEFSKMSKSQQAYYRFLQAYQATYRGELQQAEKLLTEIVNSDAELQIRFRAAYTVANVQGIRRQFVAAFTNLTQALSWLQQIKDADIKLQALLTAANIYAEASLFNESLDYLQQAISNELKPRDKCLVQLLTLQNNNNLGNTNADSDIDSGIRACGEANEQMMLSFVRLQFAYKLNSQQQPKLALQQLVQFLPDAEKTAYGRLLTEYYYLLGWSTFQLADYSQSLDYLKKLSQVSKNQGFSTPVVAGLKLQAEIAAKQQNFAQAYQLHQQYMAADRALMDDRAAQLLAFQLAKGELLKKNQQLALVEEQYRVVELESLVKDQEALRNKMVIGFLAVASFALIGLAVRLFRRHHYYKRAAEKDSLTGISNRFHFEQRLNYQLKRCKSLQKPLGVIVFDLDFFKRINDSFGHEAGDRALQATVDICNHFIRSEDIFGRIGGEEFAIALPECQPDKVMMLAEICRDALENLDCSNIAPDLSITASFGVSMSQSSGYDYAELLRHADQALYLAKYNGRNKVECYDRFGPSSDFPIQQAQYFNVNEAEQK